MVIFVQFNAVEMKDVYIIGSQTFEAPFDAGHHLRRAYQLALVGEALLGGEDNLAAINLFDGPANNRLGAICLRRIDEIDPQVKGSPHHGERFGFAAASILAQAAGPAAPQAHHAGLEAGPAQDDILHQLSPPVCLSNI